MRSRISALMIIAVTLCTALCGCSGSGKPYATPDPMPTANVTARATLTPQEEDYQMANADYTFEIGHYEDMFMSIELPDFLRLTENFQNTRTFGGASKNKLLISCVYTWDLPAKYDSEVAIYDYDSYNEYLTGTVSRLFTLFTFDNIVIDGHEAVKATYDYNYEEPGQDPAHFIHYMINVNGWVMTIVVCSRDDIPESINDAVMGIKFKEGF